VGLLVPYYQRYGPIFTFRLLHRPMVVMAGPEANHFLMVSGAQHFSWRSGIFGEGLIPVLGDGLITTDGSYHDRARQISMPAFHSRRMDAALAVMLDETDRALDTWRSGDNVDVYTWVRDLAMRIAMRALVGIDPHHGDSGHELADYFERALSYTVADLWKVPLRGPGTPWRRLHETRKRLDPLILAEIQRRRREPNEGEDILSMLLTARDDEGDGFSDRELRDQVVTLLFGGHDTSSSTVAFLLYELARNPDVLLRVQEEQDRVLGGVSPTAAQLGGELVELDMALDETLRRYPPVWFSPRMSVSPFEFAGRRVPAGTHVMASAWVSHHLPDVFEDPASFKPERFAPEARRALPKGAYIPFGGGQRICIGKRFGQLAVKSIATTVLQRLRLELPPGHKLTVEMMPTLSPGGGLPMVVRERTLV
jgi:cytochrome P450